MLPPTGNKKHSTLSHCLSNGHKQLLFPGCNQVIDNVHHDLDRVKTAYWRSAISTANRFSMRLRRLSW